MEYFEIELLDEAKEFIDSFDLKTRKKIYYVLQLAKTTKDPELFKKLAGTEIQEFRILYNRVKYRLFAFWDNKRNAYVLCTHGIIKKTDKTPVKEIEKAENMRKQYFEYGK